MAINYLKYLLIGLIWLLDFCGLFVYICIDKIMIQEYRKSKSKELFQLITIVMASEAMVLSILTYVGILLIIE